MATKFCSNCGAELREDSKFCASCGQSVSDETGATSQLFGEGIVLKSPEQIPDRTAYWAKTGNVISAGLMFIGFLLLLYISKNDVSKMFTMLMAVCFLGGLLGAGFTRKKLENSVHIQMDELRVMKFKFVYNVTASEVFNKMKIALQAHYGDKFKIDLEENGIISVVYNKTIYDICLNDDGTFIVHWRKSLGKAVRSVFSTESFKLLREVRRETGLIAYELQKQFNITE